MTATMTRPMTKSRSRFIQDLTEFTGGSASHVAYLLSLIDESDWTKEKIDPAIVFSEEAAQALAEKRREGFAARFPRAHSRGEGSGKYWKWMVQQEIATARALIAELEEVTHG